MPGGSFAFPVGTCHEIIASFTTSGAAADIAVVVRVAVAELHRVVAVFFYGRNRQHQRLGAQVHAKMKEYGVSLLGVMTAVSL